MSHDTLLLICAAAAVAVVVLLIVVPKMHAFLALTIGSIDRLDGGRTTPSSVTLPPRLVVRGTTGPVPGPRSAAGAPHRPGPGDERDRPVRTDG
jgi:hypothetical protein